MLLPLNIKREQLRGQSREIEDSSCGNSPKIFDKIIGITEKEREPKGVSTTLIISKGLESLIHSSNSNL